MTLNGVQSPRFENGELHYFVGDTFTLELKLNVKKDGEEISILPTERVILAFYKSGILLEEKTFSNVQNNTIEIHWDAATTAKFRKGNYVGRVIFEQEDYKRTILNDFGVCVE